MPLNSTRGGASAKGFGFGGGVSILICATGGTVLTCGSFKTHVFTGPGTFSVSKAIPTATVEYLVVAGGGGAGDNAGGGGGAGGFRQNYPSPVLAGLPVTVQAYPIAVGGGGAGLSVNGTDSTFSTIFSEFNFANDAIMLCNSLNR